MIYLFTGTPGAGKTLSAIKFVLSSEQFKNRPVFAYGIRDLAIPDWTVISADEAKRWFDLPDGSIVFLDECQDLFRPRPQGAQVPEYLSQLEKHRHRGFDFILTTQSPMLVDTNLRRLIFEHRHLERPFGMDRGRCYVWQQKCANDPNDHFAKQEATKEFYSLDKKYFGTYKSAEVHTVKKKVPLRLFFFAFIAFSVVGFFVWFPSAMANKKSAINDHGSTGSVSPLGSAVSSQKSHPDPYRPRISYLPSTAPRYDELTKPKSYPWPNCIKNVTRGFCRCYSQQGTRMEIPFDVCETIVRDGLFNDALPDPESDPQNEGGRAGGEQAKRSPPSPHSVLLDDPASQVD